MTVDKPLLLMWYTYFHNILFLVVANVIVQFFVVTDVAFNVIVQFFVVTDVAFNIGYHTEQENWCLINSLHLI